ncbi:MAG TPA: hypothetical protein VLY03_01265 [Bacteroidota bacterium]|nr:hypothetical protein [Bacteroidota bacterium]
MRRFLLLELAIALVVGLRCSPARMTPPPLPEDAFVRYYADRLILKNEGDIQAADSLTTVRRLDTLSQQYRFRPEQVNAALEYYRHDGERWAHFHELVSRRLEQLQQYELAKQRQ